MLIEWRIVVAVVVMYLIGVFIGFHAGQDKAEENVVVLKQYFEEQDTLKRELIDTLQSLENTIEQHTNQDQKLKEAMEKWLEEWKVEYGEITGYAPLDPAAVEGGDYSGDPTVTASGKSLQVDWTVAAGPAVEFGELVWLQGYGWRKVMDRGSLVGEGQWDLAVATKDEAFQIGRTEILTVSRR